MCCLIQRLFGIRDTESHLGLEGIVCCSEEACWLRGVLRCSPGTASARTVEFVTQRCSSQPFAVAQRCVSARPSPERGAAWADGRGWPGRDATGGTSTGLIPCAKSNLRGRQRLMLPQAEKQQSRGVLPVDLFTACFGVGKVRRRERSRR